MPFKSEAQRRYLWANEPEIARDWTDTYGSRIQAAHGGGIMQGGVKNYLGEQKEVTAPLKWQSSPDHPTTELAYITQAEKDLLVKQDLHNSLKGGVNRGPSGIMSLNGWGSTDSGQNVSGTAASAAETGSSNAKDRAEVRSQFTPAGSPALPPGVTPQGALDFRSAAINAGAGQRVNPGFFDSRTHLNPNEIARAKEYRNRRDPNTGQLANRFAKQSYRNTGQGGIMGFLRSGGIFGNLLRGVGQKFGLGKRYNEPTYDMSKFNRLGLGGTQPGTYDFNPNAQINQDVDTTGYSRFGNIGKPDLNNLESIVASMDNNMMTDYFNNEKGFVDNLKTKFGNDVEEAGAYDTPTEGLYGLNLIELSKLQNLGYNNDQIKEAVDGGYAQDIIKSIDI